MVCVYSVPEETRSAAEIVARYRIAVKNVRAPQARGIVVRKPAPAPIPTGQVTMAQQMVEAHDILNMPCKSDTDRFTMKEIMEAVSKASGFSLDELRSKNRAWLLSRARNCFFFLCREYTGRSLPQIGRMMGGRDHTTVLSGARGPVDPARAHSHRTVLLQAIRILETRT